MEGESGVTRSIIDDRYSPDMQEDQMEGGESGVTRSIFDVLLSSDIQPDHMGG